MNDQTPAAASDALSNNPARLPSAATLFGSDARRTPQQTIFVTMTPKGGAGKTETADALEALASLGGRECLLVDVDDGNRGLGRRVGSEEVVKIPWTTSATDAAAWIERDAATAQCLIFDLGAGIDSAELPVMAFLCSTWRILRDRGARIVFCAVVSTNAPTSTFVQRIDRNFGMLGDVLIVCNNQDGSKAFPEELAARHEPQIDLGQLPAGIQAVRLSRRERLSAVLQNPQPEYQFASAMMARRILNFAVQAPISDFAGPEALRTLEEAASRGPGRIFSVIRTRAHARDAVITQNARAAAAEDALLLPQLDDAQILAAAKDFRREVPALRRLLRS
ncbi:hypothetical protein E2493_14955 [Sphingomonas parva]|uniref:ParA family protein n=1 Tax=Sphingomonas parva TaxID=2555898 RepID=A0A4Y8ZQE5_9SPHN|nr:hypothetical protein [Sphingomonas parva]TFI57502.1 hypothetical protein E2493_14955 [Sphingomonas parva]